MPRVALPEIQSPAIARLDGARHALHGELRVRAVSTQSPASANRSRPLWGAWHRLRQRHVRIPIHHQDSVSSNAGIVFRQ